MPNEFNSHQPTTLKQKNINDKSRKFRWSSCFSFVTSKLGKRSNKLSSNPQIRLSQSYEDFDNKHGDLSETIDGKCAHKHNNKAILFIVYSSC